MVSETPQIIFFNNRIFIIHIQKSELFKLSLYNHGPMQRLIGRGINCLECMGLKDERQILKQADN